MASAVIGALRVNLGLDSAQFSQGLKQVQTRAGQFAADLNKRLGKLGDIPGIKALQTNLARIGVNAPAALGAMSAAVVTALSAMSVSAINSANEIQNLSHLANATPEEFQRWAYAADQVGISQEKFSDILKDVNDRVGDFIATGGGPMADFFERIAPKVGVTADQFRKLSGPEALQLYVSSLEKANVNQQDFTFFMEAMASDSTALLPILRNGGKLAQDYGDRLAALGGVKSNATVARLAAMKTTLGEVGVVLRSVKDTLGAAFAPVVAALAKSFVSLMTQGSGLRLIFDGVAKAAGWVADVFAAVVNIVSHVVSGIWSLISVSASWINSVTGIGEAVKTVWDWTVGWVADILIGTSQAITGLGGLSGAFAALKDVAVEVWQRIAASAGGLYSILKGVSTGISATFVTAFAYIAKRWDALVNGMASAWNGIAGSALGEAIGMGKMGQSSIGSAMGDAAERLRTEALNSIKAGGAAIKDAASAPLESIAAINAKIAQSAADAGAALGSSGLTTGLDAAGNSGGGAAAKLSKLQEVMKRLKDEYAELRGTLGMTDVDAQVWRNQRDAGVSADSKYGSEIAAQTRINEGMKSLKAATDEWRQSISSAFASFLTGASSFKDVLSQIIGKLAEMVMNKAFESLFASAGGSGIIGGILGSLGIGANAAGTNNWRGGLTAINERGAEIVDLPRGTRIIPHGLSKRIANGDGAGGYGIEMTASSLTLTDDGKLMTTVDAKIVRSSKVTIGQSVKATDRAMSRTKAFGNR